MLPFAIFKITLKVIIGHHQYDIVIECWHLNVLATLLQASTLKIQAKEIVHYQVGDLIGCVPIMSFYTITGNHDNRSWLTVPIVSWLTVIQNSVQPLVSVQYPYCYNTHAFWGWKASWHRPTGLWPKTKGKRKVKGLIAKGGVRALLSGLWPGKLVFARQQTNRAYNSSNYKHVRVQSNWPYSL